MYVQQSVAQDCDRVNFALLFSYLSFIRLNMAAGELYFFIYSIILIIFSIHTDKDTTVITWIY